MRPISPRCKGFTFLTPLLQMGTRSTGTKFWPLMIEIVTWCEKVGLRACTASTGRDLRVTSIRLCSQTKNDALDETSSAFASVLPVESATQVALLPQLQIFLWFTACVYSWLVYSHLFSRLCCPLASIALVFTLLMFYRQQPSPSQPLLPCTKRARSFKSLLMRQVPCLPGQIPEYPRWS